MKVLALLTDAYGGYGGIARYNRDVLEGFAARDDIDSIDVMVRVSPLRARPQSKKIRQHRAQKSRVPYSLSALAHSMRQRPSIIFNGHLYHSPLASQLAKLTGATLISQLHGTEIWRGIEPFRLAHLAQSDCVLCVSADTRQRVLEHRPDLDRKAIVLFNTVGAHFLPGDRNAARRRFGVTRGEKIILTVSRLDGRDGYKGHDRIIDLMPALVAEHGGAIRYLVAGDGEDRARLEQYARDRQIAGSVNFLGRIADDILPDLYRAADVFAMPSTGEGFGIVYLESMACGTPAIGLDVGGVRDAFAGGEFGACVNEDAFPDALRALLSAPPSDRQALSDRVHCRFGKGAFRQRLNQALERVLERD